MVEMLSSQRREEVLVGSEMNRVLKQQCVNYDDVNNDFVNHQEVLVGSEMAERMNRVLKQQCGQHAMQTCQQ